MNVDLGDDLIAVAFYVCSQISQLRAAVQQHRDVAAREGTRLGQERAFAYDSTLQLIDRFFPDKSSINSEGAPT